MAQLRGYIDDAQVEIPVDDTTTLLVDGGIVQIEDEIILYERATDKAILGCSRGYNSTTPAVHDDHTEVEPLDDTRLPAYDLPEFKGAETPVDLQTGVLQAVRGSRYTNTTNGKVYVNVADSDLPEWVELASGEMSDLTLSGSLHIAEPNSVFLRGDDKAYIRSSNDHGGLLMSSIGDGGNLSINSEAGFGIYSNAGASGSGTYVPSIEMSGAGADRILIAAPAGVSITASPSNPHSTSLLDISSTTKGFLPPRMTATQRDAIVGPAPALMIFNTTSSKINFYNGAAWEEVTSVAV